MVMMKAKTSSMKVLKAWGTGAGTGHWGSPGDAWPPARAPCTQARVGKALRSRRATCDGASRSDQSRPGSRWRLRTGRGAVARPSGQPAPGRGPGEPPATCPKRGACLRSGPGQGTDLVGEGLPGQVRHRLHLGTRHVGVRSGPHGAPRPPPRGASYLVVDEQLGQHEEEAEGVHPCGDRRAGAQARPARPAPYGPGAGPVAGRLRTVTLEQPFVQWPQVWPWGLQRGPLTARGDTVAP